MAEFKATVKNPNDYNGDGMCYRTPEGLYFYAWMEYPCHIKQDILPFGEQPTENIPTFVELTSTSPPSKIGMRLEEFLEHFRLLAKCEHCGKWFETEIPAQLCESCNGLLTKGFSEALDRQFSNPENYKRLKDRYKN